MPLFSQISITDTTLTAETYNFTVEIKECSSSNFITVATGVKYSEFPYLVNLNNYITDTSCYDYSITETTTSRNCQSALYPSPTPSISPTPTVTPTPSASFGSNLAGAVLSYNVDSC